MKKLFLLAANSYGPVAQLGERSVRIREVESSSLFRSTISRKITANSAVIFCLIAIIPQRGIIFGYFTVMRTPPVRRRANQPQGG